MNAPTVSDPSFLTEAGNFFVSTLRDMASRPGAPASVTTDWQVIEAWLNCSGRNLTPDDNARIGDAWHSYLAIGLAPSSQLQPAFDTLCAEFKLSGSKPQRPKPPTQVMDVFDRLLATETDIKKKRAQDIAEERARLEPLIRALGTRRSKQHWWRRQSKRLRQWVFVSAVWALSAFTFYALFDPFGHGAWRYWSEGELLQMVFVMSLPVVAALLKAIYEKYVK